MNPLFEQARAAAGKVAQLTDAQRAELLRGTDGNADGQADGAEVHALTGSRD